MFAKDWKIVFLLDFYGDVLSEHCRNMMNLYYNNDLSLAEIAESEGLSRQGVRHMIKKGEEELRFLEEKLGLADAFVTLRESAEALLSVAKEARKAENETFAALADKAERCAELILSKQ